MRRVILLRHGRTEATENRLYCGHTNLPLSPKGLSDLDELLEKRDYPSIHGFSVFTSGMLRAEQTLACLFGAVPHERIPALREMNFGNFEMQAYEDLKNQPEYIAWCSGNNDENRCPGGESGREMTERVLAAYSQLLKTSGNLLVVCHGGPIAAIMEHCFPACRKHRYQWQPQPGHGYLLTYQEETAASFMEIPNEKAIG